MQNKRIFLLSLALLAGFLTAFSPETALAITETLTGSATWVAPAGVTSVTAEVWGAGGGGGGGYNGIAGVGASGGGGGGGGAYSKKINISVTPGSSYTLTIGGGGNGGGTNANGAVGGDSYFCNSTSNCASINGTAVQSGAKGGSAGNAGSSGGGGSGGSSTAGFGDTKFSGGNGANGTSSDGGGGGGSAGDATIGGNASSTTAGTGGASGGGNGSTGNSGTNNTAPGGGGGGGDSGSTSGSAGKAGKAILTYQIALTVTGITASNKTYDGATSATLDISNATLVGVVGGNSVTLNTSSVSGTFNDANVGTGKTVTISGLTLGGADAANYTLTQPTTTANITTHSLTITASNQSKNYGNSTLDSSGFSGSGLQNAETISAVTLSSNATLSTSANANVGTWTITPSSPTSGTFIPSNYSITYATGTLTVSAIPLTVTGITASNKTYDGTTSSTLNTGSGALSGAVTGDTVTLNTGSAVGTFSDKHVGAGKTVTVSGLTISGTDAGNYTLTQPTTTANITAHPITITANVDTKVYNGTTSSSVAPTISLGTLSNGDSISGISQTFDNKNIGTGKTLTASGTVTDGNSGNNYTATFVTNTSGAITAKPLTVTGITASNKTYDGTISVTLNTGSASLSGLIGGDSVTLNTASVAGTFDSASVGTGKTVTISGLALGGADSSNYTLSQPTTTANITSRGLIITASDQSKTYGNSSLNTSAFTISGLQNSETVGSVTLASNSTLSTGGNHVVGTSTITPSAASGGTFTASNYSITYNTGTLTVSAKPVTITGVTLSNKIYDGTASATLNTGSTTLSGVVSGDTVALNMGTGSFSNKNVGTEKTVTISGFTINGADSLNYSLSQPASSTANITARPITITATSETKVYDGTTSSSGTPTVTSGALQGSDTLSALSQTFNNKNVGTGKTLSISGVITDGNGGANYTLTLTANTSGSITAKPLTVTGITASNKTYDGTTSATLNTGSGALVGVLGGDTVTLNTASATGIFDNANVGTGKAVTISGLSISGLDAANYILTQPTTTANITARAITITASASTKVYDSTTTSSGSPTITSGTLQGVDTIASISQTFDNKNVGTGKTVSATGAVTDGNSGNNYTATFVTSASGVITAKNITVTGVTASNKTYDGTTSATLNTGSGALVGVLGGDTVTLNTASASGTFDSADIGTGKTVTISGLALGGADSSNYTLTQPGATADITSKPVGGGGRPMVIIPPLPTPVNTPPASEPTPPAVSSAICPLNIFYRNFKIGMSGVDVKCLQILLNTSPDTQIAITGPGSKGQESKYFGTLTKIAVAKFQEKYRKDILLPTGLQNGTGMVSTNTLSKIRELFYGLKAVSEQSAPQAKPETICLPFTLPLQQGMKNKEVEKLQKFLQNSGFLNSKITGYFGPLTRQGIMDFQLKYSDDILKPAGLTNPTGIWYSMSIKKANELIGCKS